MSRSGVVQVWAPDGTEIPPVPAPVAVPGAGLGSSLGPAAAGAGADIDAETMTCNGERFDMGYTIDGLLSVAGHLEGKLPPDYVYDEVVEDGLPGQDEPGPDAG